MAALKYHKAGATSHHSKNWNSYPWNILQRNVQRLQARIVKATQEGRWGKVKSLQHLLTHSFSGKALAVKRVTENTGKRTAGVDNIIWNTPTKKVKAIQDLKRKGYKPLPLRRLWIPKRNGEKRPLGIPTMKDRAMQALYLQALDPVVETMSDPNSYGFRKGRSPHDAIEQCFCVLGRKCAQQWILEGDIHACFDHLDHRFLLNHTPMDKTILGKWLEAGFIDKGGFYPTESGAPQGGIISPTLANVALNGLEVALKAQFTKIGCKNPCRVHLIRYADDFVIVAKTKEQLISEIIPFVQDFLKPRGLRLSLRKTKVTHITEGFDFLGQNIRKYKDKLLIKPSKESLKAFLRSIRQLIKSHKQTPTALLIDKLNPLIRGWVHYHRFGVSAKIFEDVDFAIYKTLWQWAKRRHSGRSKRWIKRKYFTTYKTRTWTFYGELRRKNMMEKQRRLVYATDTPILRFTKIKGQANPYDVLWKPYFERRQFKSPRRTLKGKADNNACGSRAYKAL